MTSPVQDKGIQSPKYFGFTVRKETADVLANLTRVDGLKGTVRKTGVTVGRWHRSMLNVCDYKITQSEMKSFFSPSALQKKDVCRLK